MGTIAAVQVESGVIAEGLPHFPRDVAVMMERAPLAEKELTCGTSPASVFLFDLGRQADRLAGLIRWTTTELRR